MHHVVSKQVYFVVAAVLALLLVATVAASRVDLEGWNVPLALAIASVKAVLIVLFFMHVLYNAPLVRLFAAGGFVWLLLLFALMAPDYLKRGKPTGPTPARPITVEPATPT
jgi:cytochrome c oxidase subunit 4